MGGGGLFRLGWVQMGRGFQVGGYVGSTLQLALQSFRVTQMINAEILAKFCTTRKTKIKWKKIHFNVISYLL